MEEKRPSKSIIFVKAGKLSDAELAELSEARKKKAERYAFKNDALLSLASAVALKRGLTQYGLKEKEVTLQEGEHGKPYLKDHPKIHFNLSHAGEMALAVFDDKEVGCDIETIRPYKEDVVNHCYSKEEKRYVENSPNKDEAFTRIWVYKESFLKAIGVGITAKLSSFTALPASKGILLTQEIDPREWAIEEIKVEGYIAAICHQNPKYKNSDAASFLAKHAKS